MTTTTTTAILKEKIDWDNTVVPEAEKLMRAYVEREGAKPTLRIIHYLLISKGTSPATSSSYKQLSAAIVKAKKAGKFPIDAFVDEVRKTIINFRQVTEYITPEDFIDDRLCQLEYADDIYREQFIPKWYNQDNYVEVWIEKGTLKDVFSNYLKDKDVPISVNHGNSGFQFFTDNCKRLKELYSNLVIRGENKRMHIRILYFGDFDPSGCNMSIYLQQNLRKYLKENLQKLNPGADIVVEFHRIALDLNQIVKYDLIFKPQDLDTMQKLLADPNIKAFVRRLRENPLYPKIKEKLESDPNYMMLKKALIDHHKVIKQLKKNSKGDPEEYNRLRNELRDKIMYDYDFIIVEVDALAAQQPKLLRNLVTKSVVKYFKPGQREDVLGWPEHNPETIKGLVHDKMIELLTRLSQGENQHSDHEDREDDGE